MQKNFSPNNLMLNEIALLCFRAPAKREAVFGVAAGDYGAVVGWGAPGWRPSARDLKRVTAFGRASVSPTAT